MDGLEQPGLPPLAPHASAPADSGFWSVGSPCWVNSWLNCLCYQLWVGVLVSPGRAYGISHKEQGPWGCLSGNEEPGFHVPFSGVWYILFSPLFVVRFGGDGNSLLPTDATSQHGPPQTSLWVALAPWAPSTSPSVRDNNRLHSDQ